MISNTFSTRDPICGKAQEPGKGIERDGRWYCSERCVKEHDFRKNFSSGKKNFI